MTEYSPSLPEGAEPAAAAPPSRPPASPPPAPTQPPAYQAPVQPVVARPARRSDRIFSVLLVVAALIAVGGIAFAGGRLTAPATTATGNGGFGDRSGGFSGPFASAAPGLGRGGFAGGVLLTGTVESVSNGTLTIKTANGNTTEVRTQDSTTYHSQAAATAGDVTTGSQVQVQLEVGGAGGPAASPPAGASGAPRTVTARDVTIVSP